MTATSKAEDAHAQATDAVRVLAVVVLYKVEMSASVSLQSLLAACEHSKLDWHVLVYDNSPLGPVGTVEVSSRVTYRAAARNLGIATAYNRAVEMAERGGYEWLLTLDQDTELPLSFVQKMEEAFDVVGGRFEVGAIVPQIIAGGRALSPYDMRWGAAWRAFPKGYSGVSTTRTFAFNSAAMLRVAAVRQVGGYSPYFWLDGSDHAMFDALDRYGKRVYVAGNIQVLHDLSILAMGDRVSPWRYRHMLLAEAAFWDRRMSWLARWERRVRLMLRVKSHIQRGESKTLQRMTLGALFDWLFRGNAYRRQRFERSVEEHLGPDLAASALAARPTKISVCMATYNGSRFVEQQLRSILSQLRAWDEVLVVDDCSTDDTVECVERMGDARVRVVRHAVNQHVVRTFEDALRGATGDLLFLSDQDDIWLPHKVERMLAAFEADPRVMIVSSRVSVIDERGESIPPGRYDCGERFLPGFWSNVCKNYYQGSAMAIRATLLEHVLPFPVRPSFLHDVWIGTRNAASGGRTAFLDEKLMIYRRHGGNESQLLSAWPWLQRRLELLAAHVRYALRF